MPVTDILEIGKQGMDANRQALQTTSHNIANANTPGFSRQRTQMATQEQPPGGHVRINGVQVKETIRVHDQFVQKRIVSEAQVLGGVQARRDGLRMVEDLIHNDAYRVNDMVNKFFNDFRDLSAHPETSSMRTNVAFAAKQAAVGFRELSGNLNSLKATLDNQIGAAIDRVNTLGREVADLNGQIEQAQARGEEPLELLDRRDAAVRELGSKIGLQETADGKGRVNLSAGGVGVLVNGTTFNEMTVMRTPADGDKTAGSVDVFIKDGNGLRKTTPVIKDGEVGGLLYVRDQVVNPALNHLDSVAYEFADNVNKAHREGVGADGVSGRDLFAKPEALQGAAGLLQISDAIDKNPSCVAVGMSAGAPSDNRVALAIAGLQGERLMPEHVGSGSGAGRYTLNDSLTAMVGKVAVEAQHEENNLAHQDSIMRQLENYRQSVSGVNLDEEAVSMMQYQAAFNASAKAMKVGDEMLRTILSIKD
ncbi:flagellar hook-associated protein FlgK [bacterium]|nr:flagellar hook-associated protein FlgK [bacterium]